MNKKKKGTWSNYHSKCSFCGKNDVAYAGNGMCRSCYQKMRYKTRPDVREYYKNKTYEWKEQHPEAWKEIVLKAVNKFNRKEK